MKQPLKISSQKLPWALLGIMIVIASFLQVITYYRYEKIVTQMNEFNNAIISSDSVEDIINATGSFLENQDIGEPVLGFNESNAFLGLGRIKDAVVTNFNKVSGRCKGDDRYNVKKCGYGGQSFKE